MKNKLLYQILIYKYNELIIINYFVSGHLDVVKYLLINGADVNKQSNWGATAMHFAVQADNIETVKLLLAFNAQQLKNKQCTYSNIFESKATILYFYMLMFFFSFNSYISCSRKNTFPVV